MGESLIVRIREAAMVLELLEQDPVTKRAAYTAAELRSIAKMMTGANER